MPAITNILITRPAPKGQALAKKLQQHGFTAHVQPLFDYQTGISTDEIKLVIADYQNALVIFVSVAAVQFAQASYPIKLWQTQQVFAVGDATQKALHDVGIENVICPSLQTSEGLLALEQFSDVIEKNIIIVRGDGGREHLESVLKQRGGKLCYLETYQRNWLKLADNIAQQWQAAKINCIVVTSNALLEKLVKLMHYPNIKDNDYWQKHCLWLVVSSRIADKARLLGLTQVINTAGASEQAILQTLQDYCALDLSK